ncbi:MAG TPA: hypothetical protein VMT68_20435 [Caulobacteraceae bacterium]|nr:hypothetical protein [Caulobacteraceae bacterium]
MIGGRLTDWAAPRLRGLGERIQQRRRRLVGALKGKPVAHFIHVGKTGGTAIKQALRSCPDAGAYTLFVHGHAQTLRGVPAGEKVVFFLRDPVSKFVSGFDYRLRGSLPHFDIPWRPHEAEAFARFTSAAALAKALSSEDPDERARAGQAMRSIHHVRDSVVARWFESEAYFRSRLDDVLFIGFQEDLAADFERLKRVLGLPPALTLPGPDTVAYQKSPTPPEPLDTVARANLVAWYADDVRFYALCRRLRDEEPTPSDRAA